MNYLVVHHHHQKFQMSSHKLTLKKILASVGVNFPLQNTYVTDIVSLINIYTTSTSIVTHLPTYERLHKHFLPEI